MNFKIATFALIFFIGLVVFLSPQNLLASIGQVMSVSDSDVKFGDILTRDQKTGDLLLAREENNPNIFGVVSGDSMMTLRPRNQEGVSVVRFGQVLVNVSLLNGEIKAGDYITTSKIQGYGQKAGAGHRYVLGQALEDFSGQGTSNQVFDFSTSRFLPAGQILVNLQIGVLSNLPLDSDIYSDNQVSEFSSGGITSGLREVFQSDQEAMESVVSAIGGGAINFIESPTGGLITKILAIGGVVVGGASTINLLFLNPVLLEFFLLPLRLLALFQAWFGLRGRFQPWGTVYDSVTKQPLDPAYVVLENSAGQEIKTTITDMDGRYGFVIEPGEYRLKVDKTNYSFPSHNLAKQKEDEIYSNLYFGQIFKIETKNPVIAMDIPMDPKGFDWNEFTKQSQKSLLYFSYLDMIKRTLSAYFFYLGLILAVILLILIPLWYNFLIVGLYLLVLLIRLLGIKKRPYGKIIEANSKTPIPYALIYIHSPQTGEIISKTTTDKYGRYFVLVTNQTYYLTLHKKNSSGKYNRIFTSQVFSVKKGYIDKIFKI